jgi:hypothetical protein
MAKSNVPPPGARAVGAAPLPVVLLVPLLVLLVPAALRALDARSPGAGAQSADGDWRDEFGLAGRELADSGQSRYFVLVPGFQAILASERAKLTITVLHETKGVDGVTTRVVEEREEENGQLVEVSRNFFALDQATGDVFYFGEEVDDYKDGRVVGHGGTWVASANGNRPGLIMPGTPEVGMKYYQEVAPGVAMDRAEVMSTSETYKTPAGEFQDCLVTRESTPLEPTQRENKTYAPGIGIVQDQSMRLVSYGYVDP